MENNNTTAIDWLIKKYFEDYNVLLPELEYQQAKEMEEVLQRRELRKAYMAGGVAGFNSASGKDVKTFEEYYEETYKKD